jgi:osmoprotectant transport system substrate-binding protein
MKTGRATRRAVLGLGTAAVLAGTATAQRAGGPVVVSSKIDTEGALLGNMILLALQNAGVPTEARLALGPTRIVRQALLAGEVDIYPEYTGNAAFFFERPEDAAWRNSERAYAVAAELDKAQNNLIWLDRAKANNTWSIVVRRDLAQRLSLRTMSDLFAAAQRGEVKLAASAEFVESAAALPAFEKAYGATFPRDNIVVLPGGDTAVTMRAAAQRISGVNAAMAYGTDGAISALNLVVMQDDKAAQPVYEPAPVVRAAVLERHPEIRTALAPVFASLDLDTLQKLNARIAVEGQPAATVAREHLVAIGALR